MRERNKYSSITVLISNWIYKNMVAENCTILTFLTLFGFFSKVDNIIRSRMPVLFFSLNSLLSSFSFSLFFGVVSSLIGVIKLDFCRSCRKNGDIFLSHVLINSVIYIHCRNSFFKPITPRVLCCLLYKCMVNCYIVSVAELGVGSTPIKQV